MPEETFPTSPGELPPTLDEVLTAKLDDFESNVEAVALAVSENPGLYSPHNNYPPGFNVNGDGETISLIRADSYDPALLSRYVGLVSRANHVYKSFGGIPINQMSTLGVVNTAILQEAYAGETAEGPIHAMVQESIADPTSSEFDFSTFTLLQFTKQLYGTQTHSELLAHDSDDPLRTQLGDVLLNSDKIMSAIYYAEVTDPHEDEPRAAEPEMQQTIEKQWRRDWLRSVIMHATDIHDPELADHYAYATAQTHSHLLKRTRDIVTKIRTIGLEGLAAISGFSENYALADYSYDQLERMRLLAIADPAEIARLQEHDVHVAFINKMGDDNNVLASVPHVIDDESKRLLPFETQSWTDMYRFMLKLHKLGIAPSTIIFAHHGAIAQAPLIRKPAVGETDEFMSIATIHARAYVEKANSEDGKTDGYFAHPMHDMRGFVRMVEDFMQPSRGIDDDPDAKGQKTFILDSCYSATELPIKDISASTGETVKLGDASIVGQLATDLHRNDVQSHVVLYGAKDGIQTKPTPRGFRYTVRPESYFGERQETGAARYEIKDGILTHGEVNDVVLRKFDKQEETGNKFKF